MQDFDSLESLAVSIDGHVATVELIGPGKGNAMGPAFWRETPGVFEALDAEDDIRAVIVRGRGDHFTYGLDLQASAQTFMPMVAGQNMAKERTELHALIREWQQAFTAIAKCRKPVIAAIDGWCIGGGVNMIAACDIRVCTADAKFSLREPRIAITPDVGALQRLPGIIGEGATRLMAFTAGDYDADFAERVGLVEQVFADRAALDAGTNAIAEQICANAPLAVQGAKRVLNYCKDASEEAGLEYVATWNSAFLQSKDLGEAFAAFAERRDPEYEGH
ncbi:MAG: crotonase/enoyl-CoA hydratase family protein [Persicimonas sp.]